MHHIPVPGTTAGIHQRMMGEEVMKFPSLSHSQLESLGEGESQGTGLTLMMGGGDGVMQFPSLSHSQLESLGGEAGNRANIDDDDGG